MTNHVHEVSFCFKFTDMKLKICNIYLFPINEKKWLKPNRAVLAEFEMKWNRIVKRSKCLRADKGPNMSY